jgi:hypothetical protein
MVYRTRSLSVQAQQSKAQERNSGLKRGSPERGRYKHVTRVLQECCVG